MLRFFAATFINTLLKFEHARGQVAVSVNPEELQNSLDYFRHALTELRESIEEIGLSFVLKEQLRRLEELAAETTDAGNQNLLVHSAQEFDHNLVNELTSHLFFAVPPTRKGMYLSPVEWFGESVVASFPNAGRDIHDACQCFALAQWTAAVFHCMRVVELGLRSLANDLAVPHADYEDWKKVLDQIGKKVRQMEQEPKSAAKIERVKYYSEAVAQFRLFKDAFRNHVSHSRTSYDEQHAHKILGSVRDFMLALVNKPSVAPG